MHVPPQTPVLVGAAAIQQREDDPTLALEPLELMIRALAAAADDAGAPELLERADSIRAPRGFWDYPDPCRQIGKRFGAAQPRTIVSELGILQTTPFGEAARDIATGKADVVLITGGEAKYRALRAQIAGVRVGLTKEPGEPDEVQRPHGEILSVRELNAGLGMPVGQYAMMDNALRAAEGQSIDAHRREVAAVWAGMSRVAADNPEAWSRRAYSEAEIREPSDQNRMLAFPYTKLHNSQWNVDQAAGLIMCSVATARALGIPRERWVFPLAVADSNFMLPMTERAEPHRSFGFFHAGRKVLAHVGCGIDEIEHLELYSCFPIAVRAQMRELGISNRRAITLTGGMAFAGGPLNNFALQALPTMVDRLRANPGSLGMATAVSGMLTKQGISLWSSEPCTRGFAHFDVSEDTQRDTTVRTIVDDASGHGRIVTYTVLYAGDAPSHAALLCDLDDGTRALVRSDDASLMERMMREEFCGRAVQLHNGALA